MDNILYSLSKVSDALTDKTLYYAHVQTNGTLGRDELAERLADRTKQDVSLWKYFLDALSDEIGIQLLAGYRINLGQLTTGFAIRGAFMSEDDAFDHARHKLVAAGGLRPARLFVLWAIRWYNTRHEIKCDENGDMHRCGELRGSAAGRAVFG